MEKEDIRKALEAISKCGITVAGDLVLEKKVENEIGNVETGGIGIQIVNDPQRESHKAGESACGEDVAQMPSCEQMRRAVENTAQNGYWWSSRSWAVVYRVYQMKGYMAGISQFVREVQDWEVQTGFDCNYDAVQKPLAKGLLSGSPDKWVAQGAQGQAVKLAEALLEELAK